MAPKAVASLSTSSIVLSIGFLSLKQNSLYCSTNLGNRRSSPKVVIMNCAAIRTKKILILFLSCLPLLPSQLSFCLILLFSSIYLHVTGWIICIIRSCTCSIFANFVWRAWYSRCCKSFACH